MHISQRASITLQSIHVKITIAHARFDLYPDFDARFDSIGIITRAISRIDVQIRWPERIVFQVRESENRRVSRSCGSSPRTAGAKSECFIRVSIEDDKSDDDKIRSREYEAAGKLCRLCAKSNTEMSRIIE
jgi:hypothetical protein